MAEICSLACRTLSEPLMESWPCITGAIPNIGRVASETSLSRLRFVIERKRGEARSIRTSPSADKIHFDLAVVVMVVIFVMVLVAVVVLIVVVMVLVPPAMLPVVVMSITVVIAVTIPVAVPVPFGIAVRGTSLAPVAWRGYTSFRRAR